MKVEIVTDSGNETVVVMDRSLEIPAVCFQATVDGKPGYPLEGIRFYGISEKYQLYLQGLSTMTPITTLHGLAWVSQSQEGP